MVTVKDGTVCKWQFVVIVHSGLWRTLLRPSLETALLQGAVQGQAGFLCWHLAPENLQFGGLDPNSLLDHTHQTQNCAAARQNHLKIPRMDGGGEGDQSDAQTDKPAGLVTEKI